MATTDISELADRIRAANAAYHDNDSPVMPDAEYDQLVAQLSQLDPDHPVLRQVGSRPSPASPLAEVRHEILMGSTFKCDTEPELRQWLARWNDQAIIVTHKADGISAALKYVDGRLVRAVSRGDGEIGEDITHTVKAAVPGRLREPLTVWVRGELVLPTWRLDELNRRRVADGEKPYENPRNAAAGIARRLDGQYADSLQFLAFELLGLPLYTKVQQLACLRRQGFETVPDLAVEPANLVERLFGICQAAERNRDKLGYWIDGLILELDDREQFERAGVVDRRSRGMIAWKFPAEIAITTLRQVTWQIGAAQGTVTPVAIFDPVRLGGAEVGRATLHNYDEIKRLGVTIGARIEIAKAGDIIPIVRRVVSVPDGAKPIAPPTRLDGYAVFYRHNTDGTRTVQMYVDSQHPAVCRGRLKNWIQKTGIEGIGDELLDTMLPEISIVDLYSLPPATIFGQTEINGRKLGEKRARKILDQIDRTRRMTIDRFLGSLGIRNLGRRRVQLIREAWASQVAGDTLGQWRPDALDTPDNWFSTRPSGFSLLISYAQQLGIPGIAADIQRELDERRSEIMGILEHIEIVAPTSKPVADDSPLAGKSLCFTECRPSAEEAERLEQLGAAVKSGVSRKLDYLVAKQPDSTTGKAVKARELGVTVIGYNEFKELL